MFRLILNSSLGAISNSSPLFFLLLRFVSENCVLKSKDVPINLYSMKRVSQLFLIVCIDKTWQIGYFYINSRIMSSKQYFYNL